jgi:hypothetical protein
MIAELKKEVEEMIQRPVRSRGDCEFISNTIYEKLNLEISYNTLRRLYGLAPFTKPSNKTLDTLAKFIGYNNYVHFSQTYQFKNKIDLTQITFKAIANNNEDYIIDLVIKTRYSKEDFISFIILLTRELLHIKNYQLLNKLFKIDELKYESFSYTEVLNLGNSVGLIFRTKPDIDSILLKNENFLRCIYLTFVDYSNLNGYYGKFAQQIINNDISYDISIFSSALLEFKNFLNHKPSQKILISKQDQAKFNPILNSRLAALELIVNNQCETLTIMAQYTSKIKSESIMIDYFYELFILAILTKNNVLMKFLIDKVNIYTTKYYYQKHYLNCYYLMCAFYYRINGLGILERKFYKLYDESSLRYSYEDFIKILHKVYLFDKYKKFKQKELIKEKYIKLSKKLNYSIFSDSFILDYFN